MTDGQNETVSSKPKLLLADDSVTIRKVVELTFAEEGVDVTAVGSGEEAMQNFVQEQPDIVLVDVNMPDPTGYHICEMIKQDDSTRHIPVLLLVGSFEPFDQDLAERVGADGFMVKPFQSIRELVGKVNELLGPDKEPVLPTPETSDIDILYQSSLAETYKVGEADTADIFLGDAGLDDEIIETTHPSDSRHFDDTADIEAQEYSPYDAPADHMSEIEHIDEPYETERSDQSFESEPVDQPLEVERSDQPFEIERIDPQRGRTDLQFHNEPVEQASETESAERSYDEPIGPVFDRESDDRSFSEPVGHTFESEHTDLPSENEPVDHPVEIEDTEHSFSEPAAETEPDVALKGFDWSAAPVEEPVPETASNGSLGTQFIMDEDEPLDLESNDEMEVDTLRDMELEETPSDQASVQEPTDEFIAKVAALVVEKLSDRVVREIARDAVPRIAENLIREALDEEKKR